MTPPMEISQRPKKSMEIPLGNLIRKMCAAQSIKSHKGWVTPEKGCRVHSQATQEKKVEEP